MKSAGVIGASKSIFVTTLCIFIMWFEQTNATPLFESQKLLAGDGDVADAFGWAIAVSGDTVAVGANDADIPFSFFYGAVYVAIRTEVGWIEQAKLTANDRGGFDGFGTAVAIDGDTIVVGANGDDDLGPESGSAYVFVRNGSDWVQQQKLSPSDGAAGDQFGWSVAISGDTAVIGAFRDDDHGLSTGSAYVFSRNGGSWAEQAKLTATDGTAFDEFGFSVGVSGETALIGAISDSDNGSVSGSAYVYVRSGANWFEQAKLIASDGAAGDNFGWSLAISGDIAVIGARNDDDNGPQSGSAYVFTYTGSTWTEQAKLIASDGAAFDQFGRKAALSENTAVLGAFGRSDNGNRSGAAYVFRRSGSSWSEQAKLSASDGAAFDELGRSVAVATDTAMIGAPGDDDNGSSSGSVYIFDLPNPVIAATEDLIAMVLSFNLQQGINNALDSKLSAVIQILDDVNQNNDIAAMNVLLAFIQIVEAQRGKKITDAQADELVNAAQAILDLLND